MLRTLLLLTLLTCSGCAGLTVAGAASAIGAAGSALDTGTSVWGMGKLDSAELATRGQCRQAVQLAAADMGLSVDSQKTRGNGNVTMELVDDRHKVIDVRLRPRTGSLTLLQIDVGLFGSEPTARLMLARIRHHLAVLRENPPPSTQEDEASRLSARSSLRWRRHQREGHASERAFRQAVARDFWHAAG